MSFCYPLALSTSPVRVRVRGTEAGLQASAGSWLPLSLSLSLSLSLWRPSGPLLSFPPSQTKWVKSTDSEGGGGGGGCGRELWDRPVVVSGQGDGCQRAAWCERATHWVCLCGAERVLWQSGGFVCSDKMQIFAAHLCQITHTAGCKLWPSASVFFVGYKTYRPSDPDLTLALVKDEEGDCWCVSMCMHMCPGSVPVGKYDRVIWATVTVLLTQIRTQKSLTSISSKFICCSRQTQEGDVKDWVGATLQGCDHLLWLNSNWMNRVSSVRLKRWNTKQFLLNYT